MNTNRSKAFEAKVKTTIDNIYSATVNEPFTHGFSRKRNSTMSQVGSILCEMNLIKNIGNPTSSVKYIWNDAFAPTNTLYEQVITRLRERQAERKTRHLVATVLSVEKVVDKDATPAISLVTFTDQQLWDELKKREYVIKDNRLVKSIYLS